MSRNELLQAASDGDAQAAFDLAFDYIRQGSLSRGRRWMQRAAQADHAEAIHELGIMQLHGLGQGMDEAAALKTFEQAHAAGSASASLKLAEQYYSGYLTPMNPERTREYLQTAVERGSEEAARIMEVLGEEIEKLFDYSQPCAEAVTLSDSIQLRVIDQMLSEPECQWLIEQARPHLRPSLTINPATGQPLRKNLRTSDSMIMHGAMCDLITTWLTRRMATAVGRDWHCAEPLSILRYAETQEYKPHYDFIPTGSEKAQREIGAMGQRVETIFVYLTSVAAGGGTAFPRVEQTVAPRQGSAVAFCNVDAQGQPDPNTLHAGLPVEQGEKWLATLWLREKPWRAEV